MPDDDVQALIDRLSLEEIDVDLFRGQNEPDRPGRIFGGQVAAQALVAASRSIEGMRAHSLHGYFLRGGDPDHPVLYGVDRIRDGRSFSTRRVVARQRGKAIFNAAISFQVEEEGYEHQTKMPDVPAPEDLPSFDDRARDLMEKKPELAQHLRIGKRAVEMRHLHPPTFLGGDAREGPNAAWFRLKRPIGDDPLEHQAVLAYVTDMSLLDTIVLQHGRVGSLGPLMVASLDHAVWFHRPVRVDDWVLYYMDSPVANGARGFARGSIYTREGVLVASVAQEGLVRPAGNAEDRSL